MGAAITPHGYATIGSVAASAAKLAAIEPHNRRSTRARRMPVHRLPDGKLTSQTPGSAALAELPTVTEPNAFPTALAVQNPRRGIGGFTGITSGVNTAVNGYELEPPDQGLAVAHGIVFEINNNALQLFSPKGAPITGPAANAAFFKLDPNQTQLSDPHVLFDPSTGHWFVDELIYNTDGSFFGFAIAVSQTSDPAGVYTLYIARAYSDDVAGCGGGDCLPDYPQVGYDGNAYFVTADLFNVATGQFVSTAIYVFSKLQLELGTTVNNLRFLTDDFVLQPSVPVPGGPFVTADGDSEYLMSARNIVDHSHDIRVIAITHTNLIGVAPWLLQGLATSVSAERYGRTIPEHQPDYVGPFCASQGVTSAPRLDAGYNSFGANIVFAGGKLMGALTSGAAAVKGEGADVIAYFVVTPQLKSDSLSATITAEGYVVPPAGFSLAYPAFAMKSLDEGVLGMSITGVDATALGGFPSTAVLRFDHLAASGNLIVTGKGYTSDDGFTGCPRSGPGRVGRWGDYAAATVDPATGVMYTANEYIPNPKRHPRAPESNWGTFITRLR